MEAAQKQFPKRNTILSCLQATTAHPSAETLHKMLSTDHPDISLATVYRNLTHFKTMGLVQSLGTVNGIERFDGCTAPHAHLVCRDCGEIVDLRTDEAALYPADCAEGWQITQAQLMVYGICPDCQSKRN